MHFPLPPGFKVTICDLKTPPGSWRKAAQGLKDTVSVRLTSPPEVLGNLPGKTTQEVVKFVNKNRDALLRYWNEELDRRELFDLIQKV